MATYANRKMVYGSENTYHIDRTSETVGLGWTFSLWQPHGLGRCVYSEYSEHSDTPRDLEDLCDHLNEITRHTSAPTEPQEPYQIVEFTETTPLYTSRRWKLTTRSGRVLYDDIANKDRDRFDKILDELNSLSQGCNSPTPKAPTEPQEPYRLDTQANGWTSSGWMVVGPGEKIITSDIRNTEYHKYQRLVDELNALAQERDIPEDEPVGELVLPNCAPYAVVETWERGKMGISRIGGRALISNNRESLMNIGIDNPDYITLCKEMSHLCNLLNELWESRRVLAAELRMVTATAQGLDIHGHNRKWLDSVYAKAKAIEDQTP